LSWGLQRRRAAIAVTFDNLGEAADLERGQWPADEPLGQHPSVTRALPWLLGALREIGIRATFFVEGLNAELYPQALQDLSGAGHEVAYHGWSHETWAQLESTAERELLGRGVRALDRLGLRPAGFRPPGGELGTQSWRALARAGFSYCSPAGHAVQVRDELVELPFAWSVLDAFHYLPHFDERRRAALGDSGVLSPAVLRGRLAGVLSETVRDGGFATLLFHPFLLDSAPRREAMLAVLQDVRALVNEGAVWCAPMREIAAWIQA